MTYTITYHIDGDIVVAAIVTCNGKETYLSKHELDMALAEYVWKNSKDMDFK